MLLVARHCSLYDSTRSTIRYLRNLQREQSVQVRASDGRISTGAFEVKLVAPSLFTLNQSGSGPAAALDGITLAGAPFSATQMNGSPNIIAFYGTAWEPMLPIRRQRRLVGQRNNRRQRGHSVLRRASTGLHRTQSAKYRITSRYRTRKSSGRCLPSGSGEQHSNDRDQVSVALDRWSLTGRDALRSSAMEHWAFFSALPEEPNVYSHNRK